MGIETVEKKIGDHTYRLTMLGTRQGQRVLLRLVKALGPAAAVLAVAGAEGLGNAISAALQSITETDLDYLIDTFAASTDLVLPTTTAAGAGSVKVALTGCYDSHFAQRYPESLAWLVWAVQVNFSSFFDGKGAAVLAGNLFPGLFKSESPKD
jgi:hypothetical protein